MSYFVMQSSGLRSYLAAQIVLVCAALAAATTPATAQIREYRVAHQWPAEIDARDQALRMFIAEVEKQAPDIRFKVAAKGSSGVKPNDQIDALLEDRFELTVCPLFFGSKRIPELAIGLLPGVPESARAARLLHGSPFEAALQNFAEDHGMKILGWWWLSGGFVSRNTKVAGPETVRGLATRGGDPSFDLMLKAAGGTIVVGASNDFVEWLKSGKIDVGLTSFESLAAFKIYEHAKFATLGGHGLWTSLQPLIMSKKAWDRLSDDERTIFVEAGKKATTAFEASQENSESTVRSLFLNAGAQVQELSFAEYAAWLGIAKDSSWRSYRTISADANRLLNALLVSFIESNSAGSETQSK